YFFGIYVPGRKDSGGDGDALLQLEEPLNRRLGVFAPVETTQRGSVQDLGNREPRAGLDRQARGSDRFFKAAGGAERGSQADIGQVYQGIEGAEADRPFSMLDRDRVVALPGAHD